MRGACNRSCRHPPPIALSCAHFAPPDHAHATCHTSQASRPVVGAVHTLSIGRPLHWLTLGWRDMRRCGWVSVLHGLVLALFGAVLLLVARHRFWLLAGAFSGFLLMAPVLATSLYALSRALMLHGEPANARVVVHTWLAWQREHGSKWGNDYWCMVQFGALLALAGTGWVVTSAALITCWHLSPSARRWSLRGTWYCQGRLPV